jgi:hypothetical protein
MTNPIRFMWSCIKRRILKSPDMVQAVKERGDIE